MSTYDQQLQAAQRQLDSECDCDDHARKPMAPPDGDIYDGGWTPGATARWFKSAAPAKPKSLAELDAESRAYWGIE